MSYGERRSDGFDRNQSGRGFSRSHHQQERNYDDRRRNSGGRNVQQAGGRGGHGGMRHMGEHPDIQNIVHSDMMSDRRCLDIIDPRDAGRDTHVIGPNPLQPLSRSLPALAPWRLETPAGVSLDLNRHVLRSNFFHVPAVSVPDRIFHYNVSIFKYKRDANGQVTLGDDPEDHATGSDKFLTAAVMRAALAALDEHWRAHDIAFGVAYDGNSALYTTRQLPLPREGGGPLLEGYAINHLYQHNVMAAGCPVCAVVLRYVKCITPPKALWAGAVIPAGLAGVATDASGIREALQAMDVALLSFARKNLDNGSWFLSGNTVFSTRDSRTYPLTDQFVGMLGYHASFRSCLSGLAMVKDVSVTCFLKGGNLVKFVAASLRCDERDLARHLHSGNRRVDDLVALLKNCAVRLTHLAMRKKFRSLGPAASDPRSTFTVDEGQSPTTVTNYYATRYHMQLRFPDLPTVDVGSRQRPILIPMELIEIVPGQTRQRSITGDISAKIIQHAAMKPNDRFRALTQGSFLFPALKDDVDAQEFGIAVVAGSATASGSGGSQATSALPMRVAGTLLPPAKLLYGNGKVVEPQLRGMWNLANGTRLYERAVIGDGRQPVRFGALAVCSYEGQFSQAGQALEQLAGRLEAESGRAGVPMELHSRVRVALHDHGELDDVVYAFKQLGVGIVVVLMMEDAFYPRIKFVADRHCLVTQCVRYSVVTRAIRGYETNLLIKMNAKLGGTNHVLASRSNASGRHEDCFQHPPKSISWVFDVPAMVIGIDVSHPDPRAGGSEAVSVVAVVASMDGMLSQYCAHISTCSASREPVTSLCDSFVRLLRAFCARNRGQFPEHIIVYRDGVADSQFMATLDTELMALEQAIEDFGRDKETVKIAFVVCQKRHHTRFFYKPADGEEYYNPCVGLCVDARGFAHTAATPRSTGSDDVGCIVGGDLVEFYLNSHAAVLGTSKPTRYVLLYDGIGLKLSELELLTFWLTHLYARCTRSVSIVAPAYYAHWAARRGRVLLTGSDGTLSGAALKDMSSRWLDGPAGMYFI